MSPSGSFEQRTARLAPVLLRPTNKRTGCSLCRLMEHEDDPDVDEPYVPPAENVPGGKSENKPAPEEPTLADTAEGQGGVWLNVSMSKHQVFTLACLLP